MGDDPAVLAARTDTERVCPRCGTTFDMPGKGRGRRPLWCSPRCRRAASAERIAATRAGAAVRVIEVPRAHRPDADARLPIPSMHTLARLFLSSDYQCKTLLDFLAHRYSTGAISEELRAAMQRFAASVHLHQALSQDPAYARARDEVQRLREHLRRDAQRAADRDHELARLRGEAAQAAVLRARVAELEAELDATADWRPPEPPGQHQAALSRQQRRAAARAAAKTH